MRYSQGILPPIVSPIKRVTVLGILYGRPRVSTPKYIDKLIWFAPCPPSLENKRLVCIGLVNGNSVDAFDYKKLGVLGNDKLVEFLGTSKAFVESPKDGFLIIFIVAKFIVNRKRLTSPATFHFLSKFLRDTREIKRQCTTRLEQEQSPRRNEFGGS